MERAVEVMRMRRIIHEVSLAQFLLFVNRLLLNIPCIFPTAGARNVDANSAPARSCSQNILVAPRSAG